MVSCSNITHSNRRPRAILQNERTTEIEKVRKECLTLDYGEMGDHYADTHTSARTEQQQTFFNKQDSIVLDFEQPTTNLTLQGILLTIQQDYGIEQETTKGERGAF